MFKNLRNIHRRKVFFAFRRFDTIVCVIVENFPVPDPAMFLFFIRLRFTERVY